MKPLLLTLLLSSCAPDIEQAAAKARQLPPITPPAHVLELVQYDWTGGDLSKLEPHELAALERYKRTVDYRNFILQNY